MDIVLVHPEIPQNTGSIARTCAATKTALHLIEPLGFDISEKSVRRAGLDYWPYVDLHVHASWEEYLKKHSPRSIWMLSKFATNSYYQAKFDSSDALVFGSETTGLSEELKNEYHDNLLRIPMACAEVRSLNLSNAVAVVLYEAIRQVGVGTS